MTKSFVDLGSPITVPLSKIFLDPNNPRVAPENASRYEDPSVIFNDDLQKELTKRVYDIYEAESLEETIVAQGWVPIDPILVWEHPDRSKHHIVVEGNTRITVLRNIRGPRLEREKAKLAKFIKAGKMPANEIKEQQRLVDKLEEIVKDTDKLLVYPVIAATTAELEEKLPRLLGVRHISHAKQWGPYATNLYITSLYERAFRDRYGEKVELRLENDLIAQVGALVSLKPTKTRRNIQAASAFGRFKRHYEDQLPDGQEFLDSDQYFFENILQHKYTQDQFGWSQDQLYLPEESERALFLWAFSKPRKNERDNPNVFYKAENIRLWNDMAKYDNETGSSFAAQFDVSAPEQAGKTMKLVEAEYLHHRARQTPLNTLQALLEALKELKGETMITQSSFLKPTLKEIAALTDHYLVMMNAADAA